MERLHNIGIVGNQMAGMRRTSSVWWRLGKEKKKEEEDTGSSVFLIITAVDREAQRPYQPLGARLFSSWTSLKHHSLKCALMTVVL